MSIDLTVERPDFIRLGRDRPCSRAEAAAQEAMALRIGRERGLELLADIKEAEASLASGVGQVIARESMKELVEDVHHRDLRTLLSDDRN